MIRLPIPNHVLADRLCDDMDSPYCGLPIGKTLKRQVSDWWWDNFQCHHQVLPDAGVLAGRFNTVYTLGFNSESDFILFKLRWWDVDDTD